MGMALLELLTKPIKSVIHSRKGIRKAAMTCMVGGMAAIGQNSVWTANGTEIHLEIIDAVTGGQFVQLGDHAVAMS